MLGVRVQTRTRRAVALRIELDGDWKIDIFPRVRRAHARGTRQSVLHRRAVAAASRSVAVFGGGEVAGLRSVVLVRSHR